MQRFFALCAAAGALAIAAPALADTMYTDPATGQTYVVSQPGIGDVNAPYTEPVAPGMTYHRPYRHTRDNNTPPNAYNNRAAYTSSPYDSGPMAIVMAPFRLITAPFGMMQTANGAATGNLVPASPGCFMQKDFNGKYTAMCGP